MQTMQTMQLMEVLMRRFVRAILAGTIACAFGACATAQGASPAHVHSPQADRAFQARVSAYAERMASTYRIPGLAVLVQRNGRTIASLNLGSCNLELRIPITDRCVFHLASASKLFAGTAIMHLAQQGRLRLDDPISNYLDGLPAAWQRATVRQLMTLTSGIPNVFEVPDFQRLSLEERWNLTPQQVIAFAATLPVTGQPGERWVYAQTGPMLAGLIVERVTGKPFAQYMQDEFFRPLGMQQTTYGDSSIIVPGRSATAYQWINGVLRAHPYPFEPYMYPAGGLNSSVHDLARFFTALSSSRLLSPSSKSQLWDRVRLGSGQAVNYAFGWDVREHNGVHVVQHSGAGSVWLGFVPEENLTLVFLTNLNGVERDFERSPDPDNPILALLDLYHGQ
jgi:CubicO group peptidase (beta-lactamase class C family)